MAASPPPPKSERAVEAEAAGALALLMAEELEIPAIELVHDQEMHERAAETAATVDAFALLVGTGATEAVLMTTVARARAERKDRKHHAKILRAPKASKEERQRVERAATVARREADDAYALKREYANFLWSLSPSEKEYVSPYYPGSKFYNDDGTEIVGEEKRELQELLSANLRSHAAWQDQCVAEQCANIRSEWRIQDQRAKSERRTAERNAAGWPEEPLNPSMTEMFKKIDERHEHWKRTNKLEAAARKARKRAALHTDTSEVVVAYNQTLRKARERAECKRAARARGERKRAALHTEAAAAAAPRNPDPDED